MHKTFFLLVVIALSLGPAAGWAQDEPADTIQVNATQPSDAEIETGLQEIFDEIDGLENVSVTSEAGVVTLGGQVLRAELSAEAERLADAVDGVVAVQNEVERDARLDRQIGPLMQKLSDTADDVIGNLPTLLFAIAVVVGFVLFGGWVSRMLRLPRAWAPNVFVDELVRLVVRLFFMLIGFLLAAEILGATALLASLLGGLGVLGIALGFAIRDTVENFVASVLLSIRQPFGANEHVDIAGNEGRVIRLTSRATIMLDMNGNHVRIPNGVVYKATIVNYSRNPRRRFNFDVGVDTGIDPVMAQNLAVETMAEVPGILSDPAPLCLIDQLGDSNVVLRVLAWVDQETSDYGKTRSAAMAAVKRAFEAAEIDMPEPIYRLRVQNIDAAQQKSAPNQPEKIAAELQPIDPEDLRPDTTIADQVEQERTGADLLDQDAPRE